LHQIREVLDMSTSHRWKTLSLSTLVRMAITPAILSLIVTVLASAHSSAGVQLNLVVNEINYAPSASATDLSLRYEYVEVYNRGAAPIAVEGWLLRDINSSQERETLYLFPPLSIPASGFLTVYANAASGILPEDTDLGDHSGRVIASAWVGAAGLLNSGDVVELVDPSLTVQDFVYYDEANIGDPAVDDVPVAEGLWKDGAAIDTLSSGTTGRAIALRTDGATPNEVNPAADAEDLDWMQYALAIGGTPGQPNSPPPSNMGDYNDDGTVNAADYTVWRNTLGQMVTAGNGADGTGPSGVPDGSIDRLDYDFWKALYGSMPGIGATANLSVPEPATLMLAVAALIINLLVASRRPGSH
jgi:hypothetical protein